MCHSCDVIAEIPNQVLGVTVTGSRTTDMSKGHFLEGHQENEILSRTCIQGMVMYTLDHMILVHRKSNNNLLLLFELVVFFP